MNNQLDLATIDAITFGRVGVHDVACPFCGPSRRSPVNRRRRTCRIWRTESQFATYHCARCGQRGFARGPSRMPLHLQKMAKSPVEADDRHRLAVDLQRRKALWLWRCRKPVSGSIGERYLREVRSYNGILPGTVGFLPARGEYPPALIAAFGFAEEVEPGFLAIADLAVRGVHLTRLRTDGSGKACTKVDKIMIGSSLGHPIVLAPPNDLLGLSISEGIEDALSNHEATGMGAWAAGSASRLAALANAVPNYIEAVTIVADNDRAGRHYAAQLAARLKHRAEIESRAITLRTPRIAV